MRVRATLILLLLAPAARADRIDSLAESLRNDSSYKVRAQAAIVLGKLGDKRAVPPLIDALRDDEEAVRSVAANSLGRLGDPQALDALRARMDDPSLGVRGAAGKAIAAIEKAREHQRTVDTARGRHHVVLDVTPVAVGAGDAAAAKSMQDKLRARLGQLPDVSLDPAPDSQRFFVDARIAKLSSSAPGADGRVTVECDVAVIVATYPEHAIKMMATVGGSLDDRNDPASIAGAKSFCLGDAAKQAVEKVQTYLEGVR